jgi:hypothetical protein
MATVVKFFSDRQPRILEGVDPEPFRSDAMAVIDPVVPPGVPPHLWKLVDGKIEVADAEANCRERELSIHNHPHVRVDHHHPPARVYITKRHLAWAEALAIALASSGLTLLVSHFL